MPKLPCSPVSMAAPPPHRLSNRAGSGGCWRWWWPHQQLIKAFLLLRPTDEHTGPDPTHDSCPPIFVPTQISFSRKYFKNIHFDANIPRNILTDRVFNFTIFFTDKFSLSHR